MYSTFCGIVIVLNMQPENALLPILVTLSGILIEDTPYPHLNASSPIETTLYSIPSYMTDSGKRISPL